MRKKITLISVVLSLLLTVLAGCGGGAGGTSNTGGADAPLTVRVATGTAPTHPENVGAAKFKEILEKNSNGKIKVELYPNGQLGSQTSFVDNLRSGTLEVTMVTPGFFAKFAPILNVVELPYLIHNPDQAKKLIEGPFADRMHKIVNQHGVHLLAFWDAGLRVTTNSKHPVKSPDDLKGLKIRVPESKVNIDTWKALGANASPLAFTELYAALEQGVFDGQENPPANIYNSKLYEAQKYLSLTNHLQMIHFFMYSGKLWEKLTPENQKLITDAAVEAGKFQWEETIRQDKELIEKLKAAGMQVNEVDVAAFQEKVKPLYDQYIKEYGGEAKQIIDEIQAVK